MKIIYRFGYLAILTILVASTQTVYAQKTNDSFEPQDRPKLVVGIVVDQMRYEYLTQYWEYFGDDGFKRLVNEGYSFANNHFNYFPTYTGPGHAAVYSGATPSVNGIVGNSWFDRDLGRDMYVVEDTSVNGVGGKGEDGRMSPKNLTSTTFTDELKTTTDSSKVVAVSLKDRGAVLAAGHVGDMAFWYDSDQGNFISSTWYMDELPNWVKDFNAEGLARSYSDKTWETLLPIGQYTASNPDLSPYEGTFDWEEEPVFPHEFGKAGGNSYWTVEYSPYGNTLLKELALKAIDEEKLGQDNVTDVLAISFSSTDYIGHQYGPHSVELQDTYIRLDRDLADLFEKLDEKVGKGNYMVFLTSDHGVVDVPAELEDRGLPGGYFDVGSVTKALTRHLSKKYGEENWIRALVNQQIYLNRTLIAEKNISLNEMQEEIADFLLQFEGILSTNTAYNYENESYDSGFQAMYQRGYYYGRSGDVFVQLKPGWLIRTSRTGTTHGSPYNYDTHVPMLLYGWGIPQGISYEKTAITQLAPTISNLLQIPMPSGTEAKPLKFE